MRLQRVGLGWNPIEMQFIKWTTEGSVKRDNLSIPGREAYVSCREYVSIL